MVTTVSFNNVDFEISNTSSLVAKNGACFAVVGSSNKVGIQVNTSAGTETILQLIVSPDGARRLANVLLNVAATC